MIRADSAVLLTALADKGKDLEKMTAEELEAALREAGFSEVSTDHHGRKPWICVLARK